MISQHVLKFATVVVVIVMIGLLAFSTMSGFLRNDLSTTTDRSLSLDTGSIDKGSFGDRQTDLGNAQDGSASQDVSPEVVRRQQVPILRMGRIGSTPTRDDVASINALPLMESQVRRLYKQAKDQSCRILPPGSAVVATLQTPKQGDSCTIGRVPAITIGLEMDPAGRSKLPKVTLGQVDDYFARHRLSIQPIVYCDASGQYYFGTDCQAAFFEVQRPSVALSPEPMIHSAVDRFRALGVMASADSTLEDESNGRTLVMAFTFEKSDDTISSIARSEREANELILFHLPRNEPTDPGSSSVQAARDGIPLQVFITSDNRRNLHRLDLQDSKVSSALPSISAEIRFDKMVLMGLYPAEPVVTKIDFRSAGIISMESVGRMMTPTVDDTSMSLGEILDQFGSLSNSEGMTFRDSAPTNSGDDDDRWLQEVARRKYERLEKSLRPAELGDREMVMPKVPLMSGLGE